MNKNKKKKRSTDKKLKNVKRKKFLFLSVGLNKSKKLNSFISVKIEDCHWSIKFSQLISSKKNYQQKIVSAIKKHR